MQLVLLVLLVLVLLLVLLLVLALVLVLVLVLVLQQQLTAPTTACCSNSANSRRRLLLVVLVVLLAADSSCAIRGARGGGVGHRSPPGSRGDLGWADGCGVWSPWSVVLGVCGLPTPTPSGSMPTTNNQQGKTEYAVELHHLQNGAANPPERQVQSVSARGLQHVVQVPSATGLTAFPPRHSAPPFALGSRRSGPSGLCSGLNSPRLAQPHSA